MQSIGLLILVTKNRSTSLKRDESYDFNLIHLIIILTHFNQPIFTTKVNKMEQPTYFV